MNQTVEHLNSSCYDNLKFVKFYVLYVARSVENKPILFSIPFLERELDRRLENFRNQL